MLLALNGVHKAYGSLTVTSDVSLTVAEGEAVGHHRSQRRGQDHAVRPHYRRRRPPTGAPSCWTGPTSPGCRPRSDAWRGVCRSHQVPQPFEKLTVFENLLVAACFRARHAGEREARDACGEILERTGPARQGQSPGRLADAARSQAP